MGMGIYEEKIPCTNGKDVECNFLKVRIYYDLGGISWATYEPKKRGYYLSVTPVVVNGCSVSFMGFTGVCKLLNEVGRQSKKGEEQAKKLMQEQKQKLIDYVCNEHGITIKEKETA